MCGKQGFLKEGKGSSTESLATEVLLSIQPQVDHFHQFAKCLSILT